MVESRVKSGGQNELGDKTGGQKWWTISKIGQAGFLNFGFVFDLWEVKGHRKRSFVQSSEGYFSLTEWRRAKLLVS